VRAETVTFIVPACPPVVTDPVVVPPVTAEPVIIPPVVAEPVPNTPLPVLVPSGERAPLENVAPAVGPNTVESTPVAADPVPALQPAASTEVPAEQYAVATSTDELAQTGAKEDVALFAVLALAAGVALMVLRRKLA
jgi:LPXTG-motif cell wall-anchored protein